ncbi:MAG: hypothetical protein LBV32_01550 [Tannerellaceae bacterium]|jgi:hypothetical protein|nr:hypothetical protein [Tannerellaceae bacterium]
MKQSVFIFLLLSLLCIGCRDENEGWENHSSQEGTREKQEGSREKLEATRWKLAGIVDETTGTLKVLDPKDCEECYTLTFVTDSTATVRSIDHNTFTFDLQNLNPDIGTNFSLWWEVYDKDGKRYIDGDEFRRSIITTKSYAVTHNELTLYSKYSNLLFKLQQP